MNHAENKNIWSKMKEKLHKYSFLGCLLLAGIVFFTWTDNWQVYTEPLQETYTKGVLLAEQLVEGFLKFRKPFPACGIFQTYYNFSTHRISASTFSSFVAQPVQNRTQLCVASIRWS